MDKERFSTLVGMEMFFQGHKEKEKSLESKEVRCYGFKGNNSNIKKKNAREP